jgi:carbamoyltransferase
VIDLDRFPAYRRGDAWLKFGQAKANTEIGRTLLDMYGGLQSGADLAASIQAWFTEVTWNVISDCINRLRRDGVRVRGLGLAGGAALNCDANYVLRARALATGLTHVVVSPWSDDSGTAIGAAIYGFLESNGYAPVPLASPFLGPDAGGECRVTDVVLDKVVRCLVNGGVVALVSGRVEFGPRALGGRCLLADPRAGGIKAKLNAMKGRPAFMPFAPVVLESESTSWFLGEPSTHMAWTVPFRSGHPPGAGHPTGRARAQKVVPGSALALESLLDAFKRRTGSGILLLTSLNGKGEAIPAYMDAAVQIARRLGADGIVSGGIWEAPSERAVST